MMIIGGMQYKIPVHIENKDVIVFNLTFLQLFTIVVGCFVGYKTYQMLEVSVGSQMAILPSALITGIFVFVALFKYYEMNFFDFMLSFLRFHINYKERYWQKGVDSFSILDIGIVVLESSQVNTVYDFDKKKRYQQIIQEKIEKI